MTGAELIAQERKRQIEKEGWTSEHDDEHSLGELAIVAACFAASAAGEVLYIRRVTARSIRFEDPWPRSWARQWDKRDIPNYPSTELLVKAGALIAAEIDRLQRAAKPND